MYFAAQFRAATGCRPHECILRKRIKLAQQLLVLEMVREGKQNKQIAFELKLAETTVKAHVSEILRKLGVYTRAFGSCRNADGIFRDAGLDVEYTTFFFGCATGIRGRRCL